jgi:two-component system, LuxR family, response regulator FixJ
MSDHGRIVYIVDDDSSVRNSLARLLKANGLLCEHFSCCEDFLTFKHKALASCLILDVQLPGINGLELQEMMASQNLSIPVIFITGYGTVPISVKAMKSGAVDFLAKPFSEEELLEAIRRALERDAQVIKQKKEAQKIIRLLDTLTPREHDVLRWVITGRLNKQIARSLGTTEETIKVHRGRLMHKMGVSSVAQLVRLTQKAKVSPALKD